jgi:hypothetical protein
MPELDGTYYFIEGTDGPGEVEDMLSAAEASGILLDVTYYLFNSESCGYLVMGGEGIVNLYTSVNNLLQTGSVSPVDGVLELEINDVISNYIVPEEGMIVTQGMTFFSSEIGDSGVLLSESYTDGSDTLAFYDDGTCYLIASDGTETACTYTTAYDYVCIVTENYSGGMALQLDSDYTTLSDEDRGVTFTLVE